MRKRQAKKIAKLTIWYDGYFPVYLCWRRNIRKSILLKADRKYIFDKTRDIIRKSGGHGHFKSLINI